MALFYTLEEAAGILGLTTGQLRSKVQSGELQAILYSGNWRLRAADVNAMIHGGVATVPDPVTPEPVAAVPTPAPKTSPPPPFPTVPQAESPARPSVPVVPPASVPSPPPIPAASPTFDAPPILAKVDGNVHVADDSQRSAPGLARSSQPEIAVPADDDLGFALTLPDLPWQGPADGSGIGIGSEVFDSKAEAQVDEGPSRPAIDADDELGFSLTLPDLEVTVDGGQDEPAVEEPSGSALAEAAAEPEDEADLVHMGLDDIVEARERAQSAPVKFTCPNPACRAPGVVSGNRLDHQMVCKVCGTPFYVNTQTMEAVIGLHPDKLPPIAAEAAPRKAGARKAEPAAATETLKQWKWRQGRKKRIAALKYVAGGILLAVVLRAAWPYLIPRPKLDNQVQARADYVVRALARNEPSTIRAISDWPSQGDVDRWVEKVRPGDWPSSVPAVDVRSTLLFSNRKARESCVSCEVKLPGGAGGITGHRSRQASVLRLKLFWSLTNDGEWLFDASKSLKNPQ